MAIPNLKQIILACIACLGFVSAFVSVLQLAEFLSSQTVPPVGEDPKGDGTKKPGEKQRS